MNITKINNKYSFLFDIPKEFVPYKRNKELFSLTVCPKGADAFMINPVKSGIMKNVEKETIADENCGGILIRSVVGISCMNNIDKNFTYGCLVLSGVINEMLADAYRFDKVKNLTFKRPGFNNDFFRELENAAGYELRLYGEF